jgi:hypothetical protein
VSYFTLFEQPVDYFTSLGGLPAHVTKWSPEQEACPKFRSESAMPDQRSAWSIATIGILALWSITMSAATAETDPAMPGGSALTWEQQKWRDEYKLKRDEYQLKSRELDLKQQEQQRSKWTNPLVVAILAAAVAGLGSAVVAMINGRLQRDIEQSKAAESLRIEESRSEAVRILEMIKTGEPDKAAGNLEFLIETGLISNKERVAQIQHYLSTRQPGTGPYLPAAEGRYTLEQSEGLSKPLAKTLEKSLNDFIIYLDRLGLKRETEKVSIKIVKGETTGGAYYLPDKKEIVIDQLIAGDVDVPRREYSHHALMVGREKATGPNFYALESGFAWYLPCSFAGRPIVGEAAASAMKLDRPSIGDLSQALNFKPINPRDAGNFSFEGGMIWASLFWEIRTRLGQQITDALVVQAWQKLPTSPRTVDRTLAKAFDQQLLIAAENVSDDARNAISTILKDRGFPQ